jgi:hypothetical protein
MSLEVPFVYEEYVGDFFQFTDDDIIDDEEVPTEEVIGPTEEELALLEEKKPVNFGKLKLSTKKNQTKLDKHYITKFAYHKKYKSTVKSVIPAFSSSYKAVLKKKFKLVVPTRYNTKTVVEYFASHQCRHPVHVHGIGTVSFYCQEFIGTKKQVKYHQNRRFAPIKYYYQPSIEFGYILLPDFYCVCEAISYQKCEKLRRKYVAERKELKSIYLFLLHNKLNRTDILRPLKKVQEEVPGIVSERTEEGIQVTETSECGEKVHYNFKPQYISPTEGFEISISAWSLRVELYHKHYNGPAGYTKKQLRTLTQLKYLNDCYLIPGVLRLRDNSPDI